MCGVVGLVNVGSAETLALMLELQLHRGPDDVGQEWLSSRSGEAVGLGSRRLSILDLSPAGHMPMWNYDHTLCITYNGEVYNFQELRSELIARGVRFRSHTDTEVVLQAYAEYGPDCVRRLRGMFAFCIWDMHREQMFVARDPFGIKPLYYYHREESFACASELKYLLVRPEVRTTIDIEALNQYLTFLWVPEPATILQDVRKVAAGHYAVFRMGVLTATQYWDPTFPDVGTLYRTPPKELEGEIGRRLNHAVSQQMVSDRPVGAFLSAGLDSSAIVACMTQTMSEKLHTYTITFPHAERLREYTLDDPAVARRTATKFHCEHQEIVVESDVAELLGKLVWHMDEPVADPAILLAFLVCQAAKPSSTVLLSGIGGDEVFGGYRKYCAHYLAQYYRRLPSGLRSRVIEPLIASLPMRPGGRWKGWIRLLKKMGSSASLPAEDRFLMDSTYMNDGAKASLLTPALYGQVEGLDAWAAHRRAFANVAHADFLHQMLYVDTKLFLPSLNLNYNDKMSMANSVEVRVPFLDHELYDFVANEVPPNQKVRVFPSLQTKRILRSAMAPFLPREVLKQKKAGFGAPVGHWLVHDLKPLVDEVLSKAAIESRGIFAPAAIARILSEHQSGIRDHSMTIWQVLTLEMWFRQFVDRVEEIRSKAPAWHS